MRLTTSVYGIEVQLNVADVDRKKSAEWAHTARHIAGKSSVARH